VEWFLSRRGGAAEGFSRAIFSGFTTAALSRILIRILAEHQGLEGLYHVAAAPIDKFTLLQLLNTAYRAEVAITRRDEPRIDRSLDAARFRATTGWVPASWEAMIAEMAADETPYDPIRGEQGVGH
jgi:dTDP-4-dehydrorhamnose reductase